MEVEVEDLREIRRQLEAIHAKALRVYQLVPGFAMRAMPSLASDAKELLSDIACVRAIVEEMTNDSEKQ